MEDTKFENVYILLYRDRLVDIIYRIKIMKYSVIYRMKQYTTNTYHPHGKALLRRVHCLVGAIASGIAHDDNAVSKRVLRVRNQLHLPYMRVRVRECERVSAYARSERIVLVLVLVYMQTDTPWCVLIDAQ